MQFPREKERRAMQAVKGFTGRIGSWSARNPWKAISMWVVFVVAAVVIGMMVGTKQLTPSETGSGESGAAARAIEKGGFAIRPTEQVLVASPSATAADPAFRAVVSDVVKRLRVTPSVVAMRTPLTSPNGHAVLVTFEVPGTFKTVGSKVPAILATTAAAQRAHPSFQILESGDASFSKVYNDTSGKDFAKAEQMSVPITLAILVIAFGGLVIAGIPVALAMSAVLGAGGLTAIASQWMPVSEVTKSVTLLIGLAVGVDYSIFYLARQRRERQAGRDRIDAIEIAADTSGRAVLVSGLTVVAAMSGMFLAGNSLFSGIALGTILVVATAIIGSLTVLPALLAPKSFGVLGRIPGLRAARTGPGAVGAVVSLPFRSVRSVVGRMKGDVSIWQRILRPVLRHPAIAVASSVAVLVALAVPALGLNLGLSSQTYGMSKTLPAMQGKAAIEKAFPGSPSPAVVAIEADDVGAPQVQAGIDRFERAAVAAGVAHRPFTLQVGRDRTVGQLFVPIVGSDSDAQATAAVETLRRIVPATLAATPGVAAQVGGEAAGTHDFNQVMRDRAPIVIGFVLLLSFLLLLATFRSLIVPIKAIVLNLLSVGAAYGILVAVFQHHWAEGLLGFRSDGAIESWLPMFLFVVLFGLSMDYHVFILSRVRELYDRGVPSDQAVEQGITETAGVVTSAAVVMVAVFSVFGTLSGLDMKQLGVGLATAILIDATVIRAVLLPAAMKLLGERNWYLPKSLGWLPRINHGQPALDAAGA
jgi:RND superfamily putative drug exporter